MISKLKKIFSNNKGVDSPLCLEHKETIHLFSLKYQDLEMGVLKFLNNQWVFEYSTAFKNQSEINALIDFPDLNKTYISEVLWPFFQIGFLQLSSLRLKNIFQNIQKKARI